MKQQPDIAALTDHLGYWLRLVSNHVSHAFARGIEGQGVTVAEWVVLRQLYDVDALAPSRLAERMGMTRGAISKLADRLIAKALIARTEDPDDGLAVPGHLLAGGFGDGKLPLQRAGRRQADELPDVEILGPGHGS